jgi:Leucine-rich repeat (LRR) protein
MIRIKKLTVLQVAIVLICIIIALAVFLYYFNTSTLFSSKEVENAIRKQISKTHGLITPDDCKGIKVLDLSETNWNTSLNGLQYFIDLEELSSEAGYLKDISSLKGLKNLKRLDLYLNCISDLSHLSELYALEELNVSNNRIKDVSCLKNLVNLKSLIIYKNPIEDFSSLSEIKDLRIYHNSNS